MKVLARLHMCAGYPGCAVDTFLTTVFLPAWFARNEGLIIPETCNQVPVYLFFATRKGELKENMTYTEDLESYILAYALWSSLTKVIAVRKSYNRPRLYENCECPDQTSSMFRLIWAFADRIYYKIYFTLARLI